MEINNVDTQELTAEDIEKARKLNALIKKIARQEVTEQEAIEIAKIHGILDELLEIISYEL